MKAIICHKFGTFRDLSIEERPLPKPGPDEVLVELRAWGVNYVDVIMVGGTYQLRPELPFVPGTEAAGIITALGTNITDLAIGERVMTAHRPGAFVEAAALHRSMVQPIPAAMSFAQAAGFRAGFTTAYHGLVQGGNLQAGEFALILGAGGGMGMAAVQVAKQLGATVIAAAGSAEKLAVAKSYGADHLIDYTAGFREQVKAVTDGRGADVVFDPVGGDVFDEAMRCINTGARLIIVGFTGGRPAQARTNLLLIKCACAVGIRVGAFSRAHPQAARANMAVLLDWADAGKIRTHVSHQIPFENIADAMATIADRRAIGKVILTRDTEP
jgi:NADPH2:quinone reductase